jgi:ubiquinone/menaquinone biosynthesis C-methylase UbiE
MGSAPRLQKLGPQTTSAPAPEAEVQPIYLSGEYLARNPFWHLEESAWKAFQIMRMLQKNQIAPGTVCDVGCGAGEVLRQLQKALASDCKLYGYDVSPQAIDLATSRANERLHFCLEDLCRADGAWFDLLLVLDVLEHVEDYHGFLRQLKAKGRYKIFHIPLDISVQTVFRKNGLLKRRHLHDHLHFFTKATALRALRDTGYEVLDHFYTARAIELGDALSQRLLRVPRKLCFALHKELTVRILGGYSLLVLAR